MSTPAHRASGERIVEPSGQLDAVLREVPFRQRDDGVLATTRLAQTFPISAVELWACCTAEGRLAQWFAPVAGELRLGGRFTVEGNASGTVERCVPPGDGGAGEMQLSWEFGEDVSQLVVRCGQAVADDVVSGGSGDHSGGRERSRLVVEHRGLVPLDFWADYGPGAGGVGWDLALLGLAHHLRTGSTVPAEQSLWVTTPAAGEFIAGSSDAWGRAAVVAGSPEDAARTAARRTTVFYTTPDAEG
ncbi:polyketide cyclase [Nesterenkonia sp. K-15-9-6]|uniref:polyketide cyclase n=1 Tax=Nesterenkonia sp. K-15-9-6 TaxID=3093918 RepID=UPI004044F0A6